MKKTWLIVLCFLIGRLSVSAQLLSGSIVFPVDTDNISITVDASRGNKGLNNYGSLNDVYVHTGVITNLSTSGSDWRYVKLGAQNPWGKTLPELQAISLGNNKWRFDINNIRAFYGVPAGETILKIAILFRNGNGSLKQANTDGTDMYLPVYTTALATRFTLPIFQPTLVPVAEPISKQVGDNISVNAQANTAANLSLYFNGTVIQTATNATSIAATPVIAAAGNQQIITEAVKGNVTVRDTLQFFVSGASNIAAVPVGVRDGINYEAGNTSAVLVLYAPGKNRVSVIGEFPGNNWIEQSAFAMNKSPDGNYWWLRITGLTPGTEYAFQYLVDGSIRVADPYAEKVLDPWNDGNISAATFPNLKAYPTGKTTGIVSVLQTASPAYNWSSVNFSRPDKRSLIIYELLVRDFVLAHDWKTIRDTLNYLQRLGINAIELMPVNEFDGNESWGYNPAFFFAPDKYYGPANSLKEFIDTCHKRGIAVLLDLVLNHTTGNSPLAALYWNTSTNQPASNNPWLNETATHPFSVFHDFNHESLATRYFSSRVMEYWLKEFKVDGYRFDLSKGFTQVNSGTNVALWGQYDASRIAIWKRYYDTLQLKSPGCYAILEHFAANSEELELSNYGMMLWGNNTYNFQEAAMGFLPNSNFEGNIFTSRGWLQPHLVGYLESHDEERLMYKNTQFGNSAGSYNTRTLATALKRMELTAAFGLLTPGPKLIWQFGELGYDYSINYCTDGSVNANCRTGNKPIRWDYRLQPERQALFTVYSKLNQLRTHPMYRNNFTSNRITYNLSGAFKWMQLVTDSSNICVLGNFDVGTATANITFPNSGTWYEHISGETFTATGSVQSITLQPGEYKVYLSRKLSAIGPITAIGNNIPAEQVGFQVRLFPNPVNSQGIYEIEMKNADKITTELLTADGRLIKQLFSGKLQAGKHTMRFGSAIEQLPPAPYILSVKNSALTRSIRFILP
ncbi:MAG: 1,4-alpha-glucan-branching protein [Chitinophagia bacterium]|nr:1,4-alpha-glucan-branching protein [Chitinophagia bacterium]